MTLTPLLVGVRTRYAAMVDALVRAPDIATRHDKTTSRPGFVGED
jgi:hypothetical protein